MYFGLCVAYCLGVRDDAESLRTATLVALALAALGAGRLLFHITSVRLMHEQPARWRWIFGSLALASVLVWDGFASLELLHRRIDAMSIMLVVASSGLRASAMHSLAPDLLLLRLYSMATRVPMLVTLLVIGGPAAVALTFLITVQGLYGVMLGRGINTEFWQGLAIHDALARRTEALRDQSRHLERANAALKAEIRARERVEERVEKQAEIELRLAQKLEAVGRLATGIAHEINTPLQAVAGNLQYTTDSVRDLFRLVESYRRELERSAPAVDAQRRIAAAEHDADLPYVIENLPQAIAMARAGIDRTATIVRSIREFAHPDDANMTPIDLNRSLETTLAVARHEYVAIADLETDLGELPPVVCHGSELNQVFLNLIVNAAHAIETKPRPAGDKGRITVRTRRVHDQAEVAVADTGVGIAPEIRDRVFDPFFTTQEIGKGSGQGLAVAHSVVVTRHGGEITFESEVGRGTTFFVRIPISGRPSASHPRDTVHAS